MMRQLTIILSIMLVLLPAAARAQSETDRLREALRTTTAQLRLLQDQLAALQARVAQAESQRDILQKQNSALTGQVKDAEAAYRKAVDEFNQQLADRDAVLEKWKGAYEEAANVARSKDAERAQFESEAAALKESNKSCEGKNMQLQKVGTALLARLKSMNLADVMAAREPVFGIRRVEEENLQQACGDKIQDQKAAKPDQKAGNPDQKAAKPDQKGAKPDQKAAKP
jgi:chromosome segregation ATPase